MHLATCNAGFKSFALVFLFMKLAFEKENNSTEGMKCKTIIIWGTKNHLVNKYRGIVTRQDEDGEK